MVVNRYASYLVLFAALALFESVIVRGDGFDEFKLDRILEQLEHISLRQEELFRITATQSRSQCSCGGEDDSGRANKPEVKTNRKREDSSPRDFVNKVNKLADEGNQENSLSGWFSSPAAETSLNLNDERLKVIMLSLGQQYEAVFGDALSNLQNTLKEQLTSFALTLRKLMNKAVDHSYQYNTILNQLTYLKEECSLAASSYSQLNLSGLLAPNVPTPTEAWKPGNEIQGALKTSDITLIVRTLSEQINLAMGSSRDSSLSIANANNEELNELQKLEGEQLSELRAIASKLNQVDSVVKQSALFLSQLNAQIVPTVLHQTTNSNLSPTSGQQSGNQPTIVVTSSQPESAANNATAAANNAARHQLASFGYTQTQTSRWFTGSKVPGNRAGGLEPAAGGNKSNKAQQRQRCQSRTSLVTPTSCQQLRQAGANCTGQYYVFLRGSIRYVYCDMNMLAEDHGGGWTVILRRIDKSLFGPGELSGGGESEQLKVSNQLLESLKAAQTNFKLDWFNYRNGFGALDDWAEFFAGLDLLHQISEFNRATTQQPEGISNSTSWLNETELQIDLETRDGERTHIRYDSFYVHAEESKFRLQLTGCNSTEALCQPLNQLNNATFQTFDTLDRRCAQAGSSLGGWWVPEAAANPARCASELPGAFSLTRPIEPAEGGRLFWRAGSGYPGDSSALRRVVLKVRRRRARRQPV